MPNTADTLPRPINTPDTASILSSTGLVLDPNLILTGINGTDTDVGRVSRAVPGELLGAFRKGEFDIFHSGRQGTLEIDVVTGAAGAAVALLKLQSTGSDSLVVFLDATNRPNVIMVVGGVTVAAWAGSGAAIAVGTPLQLRFVWDSRTAFNGGLYANFTTISGASLVGAWSTNPISAWTPAPMTKALTGWAPTYTDFNGSITKMQVGDKR